jgi:pimeloyl-ACP methyl ester carboxylesterase
MWRGLIRKLFAPNPVSRKFERFPVWMALRPSQLRAASAESAMMIPAAARLSKRYRELHLPTLIMAGEGDLVVRASRQSVRLHKELAGSELRLLNDVGHMLHHVATWEIAEEIERLAAPLSGSPPRSPP